MSKFDYETFYGGDNNIAVSKEKYTKEQAIEIAKIEIGQFITPYYLAICDAFARHRAGVDEDGYPCVGWWLEYIDHKRNCPVWAFHVSKVPNEIFMDEYEYIEIVEESK